jgi:hypothetical protein
MHWGSKITINGEPEPPILRERVTTDELMLASEQN